MAYWFAIEFKGQPGELKSLVEKCKSEGKDFKLASDTQHGVTELNNVIKSAGINGFSAALIRDDSYKAFL